MRARWKKAVWAILMVQLLLLHLALLGRCSQTLNWLSGR